MLTKDEILELLRKNDKAVVHALLVLFNNQTFNERNTETTSVRNNEGFRPCHARMGTSMAKQYRDRGFLSPKQIAYWRREGKEGMRIGIYWRQLAEAAERKAAMKAYKAAKMMETV